MVRLIENETKIDNMLLKQKLKSQKRYDQKYEYDHSGKSERGERKSRDPKQKVTDHKVCTNWNKDQCEKEGHHIKGKIMWMHY